MAKRKIPGKTDDSGMDYTGPANPAVRIDGEVKELLARVSAALGRSEKEVADSAIREYCERHSAEILDKLKSLMQQLGGGKQR